MTTPESSSNLDHEWLAKWMTDAQREGAMSQRKRSSIDAHGGLEAAAAAAKACGVHLVLLRDDKGYELVAASTNPFKVLA